MLYGARLAVNRETYMNCEVLEMDHKKPLNYDVVEGKPFMITSGKIVRQLNCSF